MTDFLTGKFVYVRENKGGEGKWNYTLKRLKYERPGLSPPPPTMSNVHIRHHKRGRGCFESPIKVRGQEEWKEKGGGGREENMNFRLNFSSLTFLLLFPVKNSITLQKGFRLSLSAEAGMDSKSLQLFTFAAKAGREGEIECVCVRQREREKMCVTVCECMCVCVWERENVCECMCVCVCLCNVCGCTFQKD